MQKKYCFDAAALQQCEALTLSFQLSRPFYMNDCISYCDAQACRDFQSFQKRLQYIKGTILRFDCNIRKVGQVLVNRYEDDSKLNQIWYLLSFTS